jgi:hypothetical protein
MLHKETVHHLIGLTIYLNISSWKMGNGIHEGNYEFSFYSHFQFIFSLFKNKGGGVLTVVYYQKREHCICIQTHIDYHFKFVAGLN